MLNYYTYLNENTTKWVSFVHGAGGSSSIWFRQIRAFKKEFKREANLTNEKDMNFLLDAAKSIRSSHY